MPPPKKIHTSNNAKRCSVVIPTFRRPDALRNCLVALLNQTLPADQFEIIVVDDARSDALQVKVQALARQHKRGGPAMRYLRPAEGRQGPAAARNAGWRAAHGEIIAFTDDDTIPTPQWLAQGLRAMGDTADAAAGRVIVPLPAVPTDVERNSAGLDGAEFVTANCFLRRTALERIGGFDECFTLPWREDSDLYFSLLECQAAVVRAPAAKVLHPPRTGPLGACLGAHRNLRFDALLFKKHRRLYREKIAAAPPLHYYAIVLCAIAALAALGTAHPIIAALAAAAWLALTARFASHRLRGTSRAWHHVAELVVTSIAIPFIAVYWRLYGAVHFRVPFA